MLAWIDRKDCICSANFDWFSSFVVGMQRSVWFQHSVWWLICCFSGDWIFYSSAMFLFLWEFQHLGFWRNYMVHMVIDLVDSTFSFSKYFFWFNRIKVWVFSLVFKFPVALKSMCMNRNKFRILYIIFGNFRCLYSTFDEGRTINIKFDTVLFP